MPDPKPFSAAAQAMADDLDLIAGWLCVPCDGLPAAAVQALGRLRCQAEALHEVTMPDPKTYQPTSFAFAVQATAEDLERIAERIRLCFESDLPGPDQFVGAYRRVAAECERLEHQAAGLREIARNIFVYAVDTPPEPPLSKGGSVWPAYAIPPVGDDEPYYTPAAGYPPIDPDADGPSFDDPVDEPRRH